MIILFILMVLIGPRFANVVWWLLQPTRYNITFPNAIFGILGIIFIPWTSLMYVIVFPGGITGFDWLWLGIALFADISSYGSSAYGGKKQMSTPKPTTPTTPTE
jgi:hypothetical protein